MNAEERDWLESITVAGTHAAKYHTFEAFESILLEGIPGDFVECGVMAGGHPAIASYLLRKQCVIAINLPAQTRQTWYADKIQDALPQMYILPEDGHNEYVLEKAMFRGYMKKITSMEDLLILVHK
jgi:hypothetical protein